MRTGLLEAKLLGPEVSAGWIEHASKTLQGRGSQEWIIPRLSGDQHRASAPPLVLERDRDQPTTDDLPVRKDELP